MHVHLAIGDIEHLGCAWVFPRDGRPGDIAAPESFGEHRRETVLLIHGTFANKAVSAPAWWHPGSDFCRKLDLSLSQHGSPARCWAHFGSPTNVFAWTGDNLKSERYIGGDSLGKVIMDLETNHDVSRYHIVAHSHGGNVVLHALRSLAVDPNNLGAVIFLGTPVLCFPRLLPWLNRSSAAMLIYGVGWIAFIAASLLDENVAPGAIVFGLLFLDEWWTRPRRPLAIYGSGHAHAFEFADDEAMKALHLSLGFAQRPGDVLKQLFNTKAPPEYAVKPHRPEFWKVFWTDFKNTAVYRLLKALFFWGSLVGSSARLPTPISLASQQSHSIPSPATRHKNAIERLVSIFSRLSQAARSKEAVQMLLTILAMVSAIIWLMLNVVFFIMQITSGKWGTETLYFISRLFGGLILGPLTTLTFVVLTMMIFWSLLSAVYKFSKLGCGWAFHLFLQGPGAWWMGVVVRNAAFGGQCKKVLRPQELPEKERARGEAISSKLNQKMNDLSAKTAAQAGEALYSALAEGDAMQLEKHIRAQLTDPKLAHCQYYCEDEIINRIAELIAAP